MRVSYQVNNRHYIFIVGVHHSARRQAILTEPIRFQATASPLPTFACINWNNSCTRLSNV